MGSCSVLESGRRGAVRESRASVQTGRGPSGYVGSATRTLTAPCRPQPRHAMRLLPSHEPAAGGRVTDD